MRIDAYETTVLNHAYANEMKAYDSHVTGNGGLLCLFGHSELVNLTLPRIECTECSASRGVRNNTTRSIGDLPLNWGWTGRVFYISRVRDDWYYKISSKHLPSEWYKESSGAPADRKGKSAREQGHVRFRRGVRLSLSESNGDGKLA